jgi:hypothetical protein
MVTCINRVETATASMYNINGKNCVLGTGETFSSRPHIRVRTHCGGACKIPAVTIVRPVGVHGSEYLLVTRSLTMDVGEITAALESSCLVQCEVAQMLRLLLLRRGLRTAFAARASISCSSETHCSVRSARSFVSSAHDLHGSHTSQLGRAPISSLAHGSKARSAARRNELHLSSAIASSSLSDSTCISSEPICFSNAARVRTRGLCCGVTGGETPAATGAESEREPDRGCNARSRFGRLFERGVVCCIVSAVGTCDSGIQHEVQPVCELRRHSKSYTSGSETAVYGPVDGGVGISLIRARLFHLHVDCRTRIYIASLKTKSAVVF